MYIQDTIKNNNMKLFHGIISVLLGLVASYLMFFKYEFVYGFVVLLGASIFLLFMIIEERNDEISKLRQIIHKLK